MFRTGIKLDLDVGDLVSNAGRARGAINSITEEMERAKSAGRYDDYGKLAYEKQKMESRASGFDRDVMMLSNNPKMQGTGANGQPVFKVDQEYAALIRTQTDAIRRLTATYDTFIRSGDIDSAMAISPQISKQQKDFHDLIEEMNGGRGGNGGGVGDALKGIALNQVVGAIKGAMDIWVSSIDRTGFINAAGGGNVLGASLAERQRRSNKITGALDAVGSTAQGVGTALSFVPGIGWIGAAAGTGINLLTHAFSAMEKADQLKYGNRIAYSSLWDDQKDQAMQFAALNGTPERVRETWKEAAGVGEKYGFSVEDSAELIRQAIAQGAGREQADQVFKYERATGADRGALSSLSFLSERYGGGDALRAAWRGLNASGMKTGQYNEYLRGLQRVMEDGISKGFVRSPDQVARNLTMLSSMTNNNPLWTGEQGAQRLSKMNTGLESAVGLQSTSDIIAFRAAQRALPQGTRYEDVLALMERGISDKKYGTDFMREIMNVARESEGGDRSGMIEVLRDVFKFNYNEAISFYDSWKQNGGMLSNAQLNLITGNKEKLLPEADPKKIAELGATVEQMTVRNLIIEAGQRFWDTDMPEAIRETKRTYQETANALVPGAGNTDSVSMTSGGGDVPFNIRSKIPEIDSMVTRVLPGYFGHGGDKASDRDAKLKLEKMFDLSLRSNDESELEAAYKAMITLKNIQPAIGGKWDNEDKLNTIADSGTARELLAAINRLIEIEERILSVEEENAEITIEY